MSIASVVTRDLGMGMVMVMVMVTVAAEGSRAKIVKKLAAGG